MYCEGQFSHLSQQHRPRSLERMQFNYLHVYSLKIQLCGIHLPADWDSYDRLCIGMHNISAVGIAVVRSSAIDRCASAFVPNGR